MIIALDKRGIHIIFVLFFHKNNEAFLMSTHNICFHGEIKRKGTFVVKKKSALSAAM